MAKRTEIAIADENIEPAGANPDVISFVDDDEIDYWTTKFGVSRKYLARAVARVGRSAEAVERYPNAMSPYPRDEEG
jgi:Protein of unknown function (DUF3606)